jgi:hypothetical protein
MPLNNQFEIFSCVSDSKTRSKQKPTSKMEEFKKIYDLGRTVEGEYYAHLLYTMWPKMLSAIKVLPIQHGLLILFHSVEGFECFMLKRTTCQQKRLFSALIVKLSAIKDIHPNIYQKIVLDDSLRFVAFAASEIPQSQVFDRVPIYCFSFTYTDKDALKCESMCIWCHKPQLLRCSRCKCAFYCSRTCQKQHWGLHKFVCDRS